MVLRASPVKEAAVTLGIPVFQPSTLKDPAAQERVREAGADLMVVAAYGLILPQAVLDMPRFGGINIHASLLPRWRGAAPIQRAILAGDAETGVCIMQMEAGLDTGPVLLSRAVTIGNDDTASSLHDKLAGLGARLIVEALAKLPLVPCVQSASGVTYAAKIEKHEAPLDWRLPAVQLARQVRAFNPFPGATAIVSGCSLKIWRAEPVAVGGIPGAVIAADKHELVVACGDGALRLVELQKAGGKRLTAPQFLAGTPLSPGMAFDLPT
jgi:methionyl-tRNA formyltransferase